MAANYRIGTSHSNLWKESGTLSTCMKIGAKDDGAPTNFYSDGFGDSGCRPPVSDHGSNRSLRRHNTWISRSKAIRSDTSRTDVSTEPLAFPDKANVPGVKKRVTGCYHPSPFSSRTRYPAYSIGRRKVCSHISLSPAWRKVIRRSRPLASINQTFPNGPLQYRNPEVRAKPGIRLPKVLAVSEDTSSTEKG